MNEEGGFEVACRDRKWPKIASRMNHVINPGSVGRTLRGHYEKILYPFDVFKAGALLDPKVRTHVAFDRATILVD